MKKLIVSCLILLGCSIHSFAQNPVVEKAIKDPKRKAAEAKADVFVADSARQSIHHDSEKISPATVKKPVAVAKRKKPYAVKRKKKSSR